MSKQDKSRPLPAAKPSYLSSRTQNDTASQMPPALQGASTAFGSKKTTIEQQNTASLTAAKTAAASANGKGQRGRTNSVTSNSSQQEDQRSPSRGRHLSPRIPQLAGARSATSNARSPNPPTAGLNRSTSAIAARLASANNSPVRGTANKSPLRSPTQQSLSSMEVDDRSADLPTTPHQIKITASPPPVESEEISGTRERTLNFQTIPSLTPTALSFPPNVTTKSGLTAARQAAIATQAASRPTTQTSMSRHDEVVETKTAEAEKPRVARQETQNSQTTARSNLLDQGRQISSDSKDISSKPPLPAPRRAGNSSRTNAESPRVIGSPPRDARAAMTVNHLADAMVASSLASTRTPSPGKVYRHTDRRRSASASDLRHLIRQQDMHKPALPSRPHRTMKHTLRKHASDDEDDLDTNKRGRRHFVRKHPNMHHEGDRKRWRDKVTELERRRYEGIFAANRGLLLQPVELGASPSRVIDPSAEANQVVNVVVRDIWERSRLPADVLREIYDLVCPDETHTLNREQFVVGLWLIDQKLKGRKLPARVSTSVWGSVRHSQGIKIRSLAS